jgi:enoyl-CoA hydratase
MTGADLVLRENDGRTATLLLNRPGKLNAIAPDMFEALAARIDDIAAAGEAVGCVVLRGAGSCFSAGHDVSHAAGEESHGETVFPSLIIERLARLPQPVIAAVHGHCYTGALELALGADLIVAAEGARFGDTHGRFGFTPLWGMSQRLPRRVGPARAFELMVTARTVSGAEAAAIGLANACFPDAEFEEKVAQLAASIAANSWHSNRAAKELLYATDGMTLPAGLAYETHYNIGLAPDMQARVDAFAARKRK